ncbi:hypothetical protein M758_UG163500 [Ceratodon purpureus]|nr:hypothetical protein M758_UG163500 [Ceratodon purpureus]
MMHVGEMRVVGTRSRGESFAYPKTQAKIELLSNEGSTEPIPTVSVGVVCCGASGNDSAHEDTEDTATSAFISNKQQKITSP